MINVPSTTSLPINWHYSYQTNGIRPENRTLQYQNSTQQKSTRHQSKPKPRINKRIEKTFPRRKRRHANQLGTRKYITDDRRNQSIFQQSKNVCVQTSKGIIHQWRDLATAFLTVQHTNKFSTTGHYWYGPTITSRYSTTWMRSLETAMPTNIRQTQPEVITLNSHPHTTFKHTFQLLKNCGNTTTVKRAGHK